MPIIRAVLQMQYKSSEKTMRDILRVLAVNREYAQYNMPSAIGKDYRTILRHLRQLEKSGAIKLARTEQAKKRGKIEKSTL